VIGTVDVAALTRDGAGTVSALRGPDGAAIMICRVAARSYTALSTTCTHEGCPVNPATGGVITCPCHGSQYDLTGAVLRGPARYPLQGYPTEYDAHRHEVAVGLPPPAE